MDASIAEVVPVAGSFRARPQAPRSPNCPHVAAALDELAGYIQRQPDITLGELRAAFLGTGFEWGSDGKLAFSAARTAFIEEFDALIEIHGWNARGAELFL